MATGIDTRHRKTCPGHRDDGKCCSPTYQAHVFDAATGRRIRKTFASKSGAKRWRTDATVALRTGQLSGDRGPTLRDATDKMLAGMRSGNVRNRSGDPYKPSAIRGYTDTLRLRVLPALGDLRVREIRTQDVQKFVDGLGEAGCSPATIDSALTPLKAYYRRALTRGEVTLNPTTGILKPAVRSKPKRIVTPGQAASMLAVLDPGDRALWATAFYAGPRRGELIALQRADVNLATGVLRIERGWDLAEGHEIAPKSRQGKRTVPIAAVLRDYLDEHLLADTAGDRLFGTPSWVEKANERARERWQAAGLPAVTLHGARHVYASLMIAAGVNAKTLSVFMGHANIAITMDLYGHLMPGNEAQAGSLLDAYLAREADGSTVAQTVAHPAQTAA